MTEFLSQKNRGTLPLRNSEKDELKHCFIIDFDKKEASGPQAPLSRLPLRNLLQNLIEKKYNSIYCSGRNRDSTQKKPFDFSGNEDQVISEIIEVIQMWYGWLIDSLKMLSNFDTEFGWGKCFNSDWKVYLQNNFMNPHVF